VFYCVVTEMLQLLRQRIIELEGAKINTELLINVSQVLSCLY